MERTLENGMKLEQTSLEVAAEELARLKRNESALQETIDAQIGVLMEELDNVGKTKISVDGYTFEKVETNEIKLKVKKPKAVKEN